MTRQGTIALALGIAVLVTVSVITGIVIWGNKHEEVTDETGESASERGRGASVNSAVGAETEERSPTREPAQKMRRLPNREAWNELARSIERARREREAARRDSAPPKQLQSVETLPSGQLAKEYIRQSIRDTVPLIRECYEMELEDSPNLAGRLVVNFTIAGEEEVGGIVQESEVEAGAGIQNENLIECIRETFYTIEFPPPEEGGTVEVSYPLFFRSSPEENPAASESTESTESSASDHQ